MPAAPVGPVPGPPWAAPPPAPGPRPTTTPWPVIRWGMGDIGYGMLLYLVGGIASAVALLATGALDLDTGEIGELGPLELGVSLVGGWLGFVGWPVVATWFKGQRSLRRDFGLEIRWIDLAWGLLGALAAFAISAVAGVIWSLATGDDSPENAQFLPDSPGVAEGVAIWLLVGVLTPIAEELFFRGLALRAIGRRWGLAVAVPVSSLVFGSLHLTGLDPSGLFIVFVTASYGAVFAWLVVRANGRLGAAIVAHALVNSVAVVTLFVYSGA
jgi:membrane protease YdiL (CAAX protease family)